MTKLDDLFSADEIRWKPQTVRGDKALAVAYLDARSVQDRLDAVLGVAGWQDDYDILPDGAVVCHLRIRSESGEWVTKVDVGSPSEQPNGGDRMKAAFSDALKRAAVKFGIGRYLYRLPKQWVPYDAQKKRFAVKPLLPSWAVPQPDTRPVPSQIVPPSPDEVTTITREQGAELQRLMQRHGILASDLFPEFNISRLGELPANMFGRVVEWIEDQTLAKAL